MWENPTILKHETEFLGKNIEGQCVKFHIFFYSNPSSSFRDGFKPSRGLNDIINSLYLNFKVEQNLKMESHDAPTNQVQDVVADPKAKSTKEEDEEKALEDKVASK